MPDFVDAVSKHVEDLTILTHPTLVSRHESLASRGQVIPFWPKSKVDPIAIRSLFRVFRDNKPDILHAFSPRSLATSVFATMGLRQSPKIVSYRRIAHALSWFDPGNYITFLHPRIDLHCCESDACAEYLVEAGVPRDKCKTIYNCIRYQPPPFSKQQLCERFNIPSDAFVVGTTACIRPIKGIDILLEAAARCVDLPNVYWLLIGPVEDARVAKLIRKPLFGNRLRMVGLIDNAGALANVFDIFVMPSREEALCQALLEAMSQGACPVVSDAGGMKELVRSGIDGIVVPRENSVSLADAIRLLYADRSLVNRYACSAQKRVEAICSPENMANRVLQMYSSLIATES